MGALKTNYLSNTKPKKETNSINTIGSVGVEPTKTLTTGHRRWGEIAGHQLNLKSKTNKMSAASKEEKNITPLNIHC